MIDWSYPRLKRDRSLELKGPGNIAGVPKDHAPHLGKLDTDQSAPARPARTVSSVWPVSRTMTGTQKPSACIVKKPIGLPIEFHGHMGAAI
jgi:hypothetical protein